MIIGTAGHIDHGKTALIRALTGVDTDRLKEEKARGISIDLGFAYMPGPAGEVLGFIDVPGHEKFVHNMLAGATGIDFVLLVVAADDGVMPQTREHLSIVDLLGVTRGVVVLTKSDLADAARRVDVCNEIAMTLQGTSLAGSPILQVSSATGEGIEPLREFLFVAQRETMQKAANGRFRLAVDRSFTLVGAGTIVTGTVLSGVVNVGDRVVISPTGLAARVRSIHAQNTSAERGIAGQRCALNLVGEGISRDAIHRGNVVLDPALHAPAIRIDARLRLLPSEGRPVTQWMPVRLHHAASDTAARIVLLGDEPIMPGGEAFIQLVLDQPIAAAAGDRFVLRDTTAQRTIGGGTMVDLRAPARKRRAPERIALLDALAIAEPGQALAELLTRPPYVVDLVAFARDRALNLTDVAVMAQRQGAKALHVGESVLAMSLDAWLTLKRGVLSTLATFHRDHPDLPGLGLERLRLQSQPRLPAPAFLTFLQGLGRSGELTLDGAWVRLAGHEICLTPDDEHLWAKVAQLIGGGERFRPPRVRDIGKMLSVHEVDVRRVLKSLGRMGKTDEVAHDHFFLRTTVAEMVTIVVELGAAHPEGFSAAQFRDRLDNGRKVAIQILEFLDRHGVTLRRGDLRRVNRHRLDLFRRGGADQTAQNSGRESSPVGRPDFKSGRGRETVLGGFDSLSLPPSLRRA